MAMPIAMWTTECSDAEIAFEIHNSLSGQPYDELSVFRQQLLDVVRDNAAEVFDRSKEADDA